MFTASEKFIERFAVVLEEDRLAVMSGIMPLARKTSGAL
jgi:hypothetical protein